MVFWTHGAEKPVAPRLLEEYSSGAAIGASFEEGWVNNPSMGLADSAELDIAQHGAPTAYWGGPRREPDSALMSATEANHWFAIPGELSFDEPVRARAAQIRYGWKRAEIRRRDLLNRASETTLAGAARLGASFLAQAVDPLNIASSFIPVVGEARYARMLAIAGKSAIARAAVRGAVGAVEGGVGATLVEPLVYEGARVRGQDYDLWDSLANVGFGAALGGGLHAIGGAGADAVRAAVERRRTGRRTGGEELVSQIGMPAHEAATQGAIAAVAEGRPVKVAEALDIIDPEARVPVQRADPGDIAGSIERFADQVRGKQDHTYLQLGDVARTTIEAARTAGVELDGFRHVMQGDDVRHVLENRGRADQVPDNELPVTPADLARVPDIIANPDKVIASRTRKGRPALQFTKRDGNVYFVIEEVRAGKGRLAFKTMIIRKAGGEGGPGTIDASAPGGEPEGMPQSVRPQDEILAREPGTAETSVGDTVREINAPDEAEAQAIERIEADTAKSLTEPPETEMDLQAEIQRQSELLAEETALLGDEIDARDRATLEEGKAIDAQAAEEGKAYEAASVCMVRNGA